MLIMNWLQTLVNREQKNWEHCGILEYLHSILTGIRIAMCIFMIHYAITDNLVGWTNKHQVRFCNCDVSMLQLQSDISDSVSSHPHQEFPVKQHQHLKLINLFPRLSLN